METWALFSFFACVLVVLVVLIVLRVKARARASSAFNHSAAGAHESGAPAAKLSPNTQFVSSKTHTPEQIMSFLHGQSAHEEELADANEEAPRADTPSMDTPSIDTPVMAHEDEPNTATISSDEDNIDFWIGTDEPEEPEEIVKENKPVIKSVEKRTIKPVEVDEAVSEARLTKLRAEGLERAVVLYIRHEHLIAGEDIAALFHSRGYSFGPMQIYQDMSYGQAVFSIANLVEPGVFDPNTMDTFTTQGLTFFLQLPSPFGARAAFEQMLFEAKECAQALNAQLIDKQSVRLTVQMEQYLLGEMIDYDDQVNRVWYDH